MLKLAAVTEGSAPTDLPDFPQVVAAAARLQGRVVRTPVLRSDRLDERCDRKVFLKCENLQHAGAFKYRGATHALLALEDEAVAGRRTRVVATHSSGNHGAALARAARLLGWRCLVVTPRDASPVKLAAILAPNFIAVSRGWRRARRCSRRSCKRPVRRWCILLTTRA
jgi:threonine dehydratase